MLLILAGAGLLAGFVDAVAGGGGLIAVPALLAAGVSPVSSLATNKLQSAIGTTVASVTYWRRGFVSFRAIAPAMVAAYFASMLGAFVVKQIDVGVLRVAVPVALIAIAFYFLLARRLGDEDRKARLPFVLGVPALALIVGFYDGILGPGTGSFLTMGFVALFGLGVTRAAGNTKLVNLASNLGALTLFIPSGDVVWLAAGIMALGQVVGGYLGAIAGIRFGAGLIRPLVVIVSVTLAIKLLFFP